MFQEEVSKLARPSRTPLSAKSSKKSSVDEDGDLGREPANSGHMAKSQHYSRVANPRLSRTKTCVSASHLVQRCPFDRDRDVTWRFVEYVTRPWRYSNS
jgi:hypothetical protein